MYICPGWMFPHKGSWSCSTELSDIAISLLLLCRESDDGEEWRDLWLQEKILVIVFRDSTLGYLDTSWCSISLIVNLYLQLYSMLFHVLDLVVCWTKQSAPLLPVFLQAFVHEQSLAATDCTWEGAVAAGRKGLHESRNKLWSCSRVHW